MIPFTLCVRAGNATMSRMPNKKERGDQKARESSREQNALTFPSAYINSAKLTHALRKHWLFPVTFCNFRVSLFRKRPQIMLFETLLKRLRHGHDHGSPKFT